MNGTLWDLLQADHDTIWDLLDRITGGSGEPPHDPKEQRSLAQQLVRVQSAHEFAEELVVLPLVRRLVKDGDEIADEALQQECLLKRALNELYHLSAGTTEFEECVNTVAAENRNHLTYEQNQVWPRLADVLGSGQQDQVTRDWAVARHTMPTRPHPHIPADPRVLRTAGVLLGRRDRAADAVRGRRLPNPEERLARATRSG
jgi:hemerythrin-like domain-containing protein